MNTLRDLQLYNIISDTPEYKAIEALYDMETAMILFDLICSEHKNIAFQSVAMQLGLRLSKAAVEAFEYGAMVLEGCKDLGLYELKQSEKSIWVRPILQFDEDDHFLLDPMNFEDHEKPEPVVDNTGLILSTSSQHEKPLNLDFINKINAVEFELDMDVLLNFQGKNMPITYNKVTADYLGKTIYFDWKYDSRGRSYSTGYGINIQGNKTVRSVIQLKNKEVIKDIEPLYIALANARGFDDWTWKRRIEWAKKQSIGYDMVVPKEVKYPERYVKTIRAILDYQENNPSGYLMELDATASGIQIMAAITGCTATAKEVNLIDPTKRKDVYRSLARKMSKMVDHKIDRDTVKYPAMTHYYNSLATPRDILEEDELEAFYSGLNGLLPGAEFAMKELNKYWSPLAKYHKWTLPDGHTAFVRTMTQQEGKYEYNGTTVKYLYYVNKGNMTDFRSLVPNIIHSIDGYIARQMVLRAKFEMVHVHDCFLFHPNYYKEAQQLYREILAELVTDYNINHIIKSLSGKDTDHFVDPSLADKILKSSYAIS